MADDEVTVAPAPSIIKIAITKAKGETLECDYSRFNDSIYTQVIALGVKTAINGGASKLTAKDIPNPEDLKRQALELAKSRLAAMYDGTFKFGRASAKVEGRSHAVVVEATRRAKIKVKEWITASGERVSTYKASAITEAAKAFLATADGDSVWAEAEAYLNSQKPTAKPAGLVLPGPDPTLIEKATKKAKVPAGVLSASKAGQVQSRIKH